MVTQTRGFPNKFDKNRHDPHYQLSSPMSEDPNAFSNRQGSFNPYRDGGINQTVDGGMQRPSQYGLRNIENQGDVSQNDLSASSLSDYTKTHTEDIRKMFAKTPAGQQEQLEREEQKQATPNMAYFNKKTTYVAVKSTGNKPPGLQFEDQRNLLQSQNESGLSSPSHQSQSQGVALKAMISNKKSPIPQAHLVSDDQFLKPTPQVLMSNRIKSHNVHRVSVSSSDDDSSSDNEESDPNRTGETSNISEDSSYFTGEPGSEDQ